MINLKKICPMSGSDLNQSFCEYQIRKDYKNVRKIIHFNRNHFIFFDDDLMNEGDFINPLMQKMIDDMFIDNRAHAIVYMNMIDDTQIIH